MNFGIKWECDLEKTNTSNFSIQKQGAPCGRTLQKTTDKRYVQQGVPRRERPVFLCLGYDESAPPATRQTSVDLPRCSSRRGSPGRMPVPDGQ